MADKTFLQWPFFDESHRQLSRELEAWCEKHDSLLSHHPGANDLDDTCRRVIQALGAGGWLRYSVPADYGGATPNLDVRSLCLIRETLARRSGLADFCFALQGLGVGPITLSGSEALKQQMLPGIAKGSSIAAFAISEKDAGSDLSAMHTSARKTPEGYVINGEKTWISNAGIADHYLVFCHFPEGGEKSFVALVVRAENPGLQITERIPVIAPHPLGTLRFTDCRVDTASLVGSEGDGMKIALGTLDIFRATVGAAALGFARRALDESVSHVKARHAFGKLLADFQLTQAKIAEMALDIDASALLIYRAAWTKDTGAKRITREAAMAKLQATESAQKIIDDAVQLLGGRGVVSGEPVERLYREVRALRIYEGTSEIQKLIIAAHVLETKKTS